MSVTSTKGMFCYYYY